MRFVAVDLETSGLDPHCHGVIEFGAVYADLTNTITPRQFHAWVIPNNFTWDIYCLMLHKKLIDDVNAQASGKGQNTDPPVYVDLNAVGRTFKKWLHDDCGVPFKKSGELERVTAAGKNFGSFDLQFLLQSTEFASTFRHRSLDPTILYMKPEDEFPPDLKECKIRAGFTGDVAHRGLADAWDIVDLLQRKFR